PSANLSWCNGLSPLYYSIHYRRLGTFSWNTAIALTRYYQLTGLTAGTTYEWMVSTVCSLGNGAYIAGANFTTTGTTACYAPAAFSVDSLTDSSAVVNWALTGAASYTIRYR